jgi:addiction module HigA family antidote
MPKKPKIDDLLVAVVTDSPHSARAPVFQFEDIHMSSCRSSAQIAPIHPGEILKEEFLTPMGISQYKLARAIRVPGMRINEIVRCKRSMSVDTALRLSIYFGNSPQFWMGLQMDYDLAVAEDTLMDRLSMG